MNEFVNFSLNDFREQLKKLKEFVTDPDWVPAMIISKAIVTAEGGFLSHSAIISRELGIPCITGIGYKNIEKLSNMEEIFVDGDNGLVCEAKTLKKRK